MKKAIKNKLVIGRLEVCSLPDLGIYDLKIKVDTGAKTSSLHVDNVTQFAKNGEPWLQFDIHSDVYPVNRTRSCQALLHGRRKVKSSNGNTEKRYVIKTPITLGHDTWPIEITLTNRMDMIYLMLLGREGMGKRVLVDPSRKFMLSKLCS